MFCQKCGNEISDLASICVHCGASVEKKASCQVQEESGSNIGMGILGFFVPVAGLIIWAINHNDKPKMAKAAGMGALISVILSVASSVIYYIFYFALMGSMYYYL